MLLASWCSNNCDAHNTLNFNHLTVYTAALSNPWSFLSPSFRQRQDDVRGDAHHQRGHGAEPTGLSEQLLGPGLALRAADGQHAGRERPAAGHTEGDPGEPRPGAAAPSGRHLRPWLAAAPAQLRPATGKMQLWMDFMFGFTDRFIVSI